MCRRKNHRHKSLKSNETFLKEIYDLNPDIEILSEYNGASKDITCRCKTHDYIFKTQPHSLLQGKVGCPTCRAKKISDTFLLTQDEYMEKFNKMNLDIEILGEYTGMNNRIHARCKKCGHDWNPLARLFIYDNEGCPHCRQSRGERSVRSWLIDNDILFEEQKRFDDLRGTGGRRLSYDFYIKDKNLLIEYQGQFHDGTCTLASQKQIEKQFEHDRRKREYANNNNINLLEIWYYDFDRIEEILKQHLLQIP